MATRPTDVVWEAPPEKIQQLKDLRGEVETLRRAQLRRTWATPGEFAVRMDPTTRQTAALDVLDRELAAFADSRDDKLALYMPPQEGKSERAVRRNVAWLLARDPSLRIAIVSFEQEMATRWGRQIKRDIEDHPDLQIRLRADSRAAGRWETDQGGGVYCVGIKGALTGRPVDVLVIDDPVKDRAAAESKSERDRAFDFWENVAKIRARKTLLIQTRWHTDDLGGRLEQREPGEWRVVSIPAIAESVDDPLGRAIGEEMASQTPDARPPGWFTRMRASMSAYVFSALFQQSPTAGEGNIFKRGDWRFWELGAGDRLVLRDHRVYDRASTWRFITMDLAASTKTSADWTVAAAWAYTLDNQLVLLDRVRARIGEKGHWDLVAPLRQRWGVDVVHVESRMLGTSLVYEAGRAGVPIAELHADTDKISRALPAAEHVKTHSVWLPAHADWLDEWLDEHADFPNSRHDDQVDNTAYAVRVVAADYIPPGIPNLPAASPPDEIDFMTVAM